MQDSTQAHDPEPLRTALAAIGLADLLDGFVARARVGVRYLEIANAARRCGYKFVHEHGNVYGRVQLVPIELTPVPVLRVVTRSDVAAVHGTKRRAA